MKTGIVQNSDPQSPSTLYQKKHLVNQDLQKRFFLFRLVANLFDLIGTSVSALMGMGGRFSNFIDPKNEMTQLIGTRWSQLSLTGSLFFGASNSADFFRYLSPLGNAKQARGLKLAYSGINIVGILTAINVIFVLGLLGFTLAWTIIPILGIALNIGMLARNGRRIHRARTGCELSTLITQLTEKETLARAASHSQREMYFGIKKSILLSHQAIQTSLDTLENENMREAIRQHKAAFDARQKLGTSPSYNDLMKQLRALSHRYFAQGDDTQAKKSDGEQLRDFIDKAAKKNINDLSMEEALLINEMAYVIQAEQRSKFEIRRKFFFIQASLSTVFITIGVCALCATGLFGLVPVALLASFQLAGAIFGLGILACMMGFAIYTLKDMANNYDNWKQNREEQINKYATEISENVTIAPGPNAHLTLKQLLSDRWKKLKKDEINTKAVQISGFAGLLIGALLATTAALPVCGITVLAIVGGAIVLASIVLMIASHKLANDARKSEQQLKKDCAAFDAQPLASNTEVNTVSKVNQFTDLLIAPRPSRTNSAAADSASPASDKDDTLTLPAIARPCFIQNLAQAYQQTLATDNPKLRAFTEQVRAIAQPG